MELKDFQKYSLRQVNIYLDKLLEKKAKFDEQILIDKDFEFDFPKKAWEELGLEEEYKPKKNGLGEYLPNFCLKVPTGGGKTLLAVKTVDSILTYYTQSKTGFILWIVPSNQIYRQTLEGLKDREHPYRQSLDIASGDRTMIIEKSDYFTPQDIQENLVIMLLMLPSANRQTRETLKIFQDSGGYEVFFPDEDSPAENNALLEKIGNLDCYSDETGFFGNQIKTSLGNTIKLLKPIIIVDEGHKSYSINAQTTIMNFNPKIIVELSATPTELSNKLVNVTGLDLLKEEMIKLDLHINNKASTDWRHTMLESVSKRNELEEIAIDYAANSGMKIRPICLVQVERTGGDQIGQGYIHAEDVKNYLLNECNIPTDHIAIKTSETDDIEGIDLMDPDCPIRYVITKQALQEGWDCPFAYVLTILSNSQAERSMTQLVGRILRQPYAKKTGISDLDESYVYCYRQQSGRLIDEIRERLKEDGMGDIANRISETSDTGGQIPNAREIPIKYREKYKKFQGKIFLPRFVYQEENNWREVSYEMDIFRRIDWSKVDLSEIENLTLEKRKQKDQILDITASNDKEEVIKISNKKDFIAGLSIDPLFVTRHMLSVVPNPWIAHEIAEGVFNKLSTRYDKVMVEDNFVYIIEELVKKLELERDRLAEDVFRELVIEKRIQFFIQEDSAHRIPSRITIKDNSTRLTKENREPIQLSLFEQVPADDMNGLEQKVALYLEEQEKLLWWYRNLVKKNFYYVQGWKKNRIYPDFILADKSKDNEQDYDTLYIIETKGLHLKNEDTKYKESVFELCNELGKKTSWNELGIDLGEKNIEFQVIYENEWRRKLNSIFEE
ncbi:DEAD/DEAH box helicase family protein [Bacillus luteolus]|uniref:DEAD/DEAH box helicase family protein n=1 Tax=Litchfieldia luteola TaxID=682179 RepID=A0ABR9QNX7_9BACI|nr:DEAD/DEAH box helicase family protein [Cytobacillus luteolus]MBE4910182.1 DEAD/DEAH box helicase family protein [Cytobacillus luteolus]MBP1942249.1 type III restriction enzyme [Cytobacillus luteolus]